MKDENTNRGGFFRRYRAIICTGIFAVLLFSAGLTYAKYTSGIDVSYDTVRAKDFYFTSDLLDKTAPAYSVEADTTVTFELRNWPDSLRYAEDDISYTVACTGATITGGSGTITGGAQGKADVSVKFTTSGTYTVTATGTAGYKETLSATFTVTAKSAESYKHFDESNNVIYLTISTRDIGETAQTVTIDFPATLSADTNTGTVSGNTLTLNDKLAANSSVVVNFYRVPTDTAVYNSGSFTVKVGSNTAEEN